MASLLAERKEGRRESRTEHGWTVFESALGWMAVSFREECLTGVAFGYNSPLEACRGFRHHCLASEPASSTPRWLQSVQARLEKFADGRRQDFRDVNLDTSHLTPLGLSIIEECRQIPWGSTLSYKQLAERVGRPGAARAVGNAMACNRYPLIVPCHRVVGAAGSLGGYSAPGGLSTKRSLLALEQVT
jgi:methylated-DNA-[protein]-cysteine S-methyltransferase